MKIASYIHDGVWKLGVVDEAGKRVTALDVAPDQARQGVLALLDGADPAAIGRPTTGESIPLDQVRLQAPIPRPIRNIFCVGKNYHEHAHEFSSSGFDSSAAAGAVPKHPIIFSKLPQCVVAHGAAVEYDPQVSKAIDYEAELAVIIGRGGRAIRQADAWDHVWGYTAINDVTARDLQGRHSQWIIAKSQDSFCPMGPWAVTRDALDIGNTAIRCHVNGELRQESNTGLLIFDIPTLIETLSAGITLLPGDIISTGTPAGVGIGFKPPRYLVNGDRVRIKIDSLGMLENPVIARG